MFYFIFFLLILLIYAGYVKCYKVLTYWKNKNIAFINPWSWNNLKGFLGFEILFYHFERMYNAYPDEKLIGFHLMLTPTIMLRDLDLIRQIGIKDFDSFVNHSDIFINPNVDPLLSKNLVFMKDDKWHKMRGILSPSFSGNKMRGMFKMMMECSEQLSKYISEKLKKENKEQFEIDLDDSFGKYANDVIASTAFGLKIDSFKESNNSFYLMGKKATLNLKIWHFLIFLFFPWITKMMNIRLISKKIGDFFSEIVQNTLNERRSKNILRSDMIHLLMEAQKKLQQSEPSLNEYPLTDEDIIGQAFLFFIAGYENVATTICFIIYELALNPEIQETLYQEILKTSNENEQITYDVIKSMKYLDMVVSESMRKWPIAVQTERVCNKDYYSFFTNNKEIKIKKGNVVSIPIVGIHHDPAYYPEPDKFIPERFSPENKAKLHPAAYIPFGIGPRFCIAMQFVLLEVKVVVFKLIKTHEFSPSVNTSIPIKIKASINVKPEKGFLVNVKNRA